MTVDHRRLGAGIAAVGLVLLLTLRLWASPVAMTITGRPRVGVALFLAIPLFLLVIGAGVVVFLWGEELGLG
jgi:hypothetical protein